MDLIEVPEAKNIQNGEVTIFEELMAEDIPELKGKISSSMQCMPNVKERKKNNHFVVKLQNTKKKETIFRSYKGEMTEYLQMSDDWGDVLVFYATF